MITYVLGGLFVSPARTLVNTVNTKGIMGKGLAKAFREIHPEMFREYKALCEAGSFGIGSLHLYHTPNRSILNFPTKNHWRQPSRLGDIEAGLQTFRDRWQEFGLTSVAFPQLGCGNGGLDWVTEVRPLMETKLADLPLDVYIHIYDRYEHVPATWTFERVARWQRQAATPVSATDVWAMLINAVVSQPGGASGLGESVRVVSEAGKAVLHMESSRVMAWIDEIDFADGWRWAAAGNWLSVSSAERAFGEMGGPIIGLLLGAPDVIAIQTKSPPARWTEDDWQSGVMVPDREDQALTIRSELAGHGDLGGFAPLRLWSDDAA